MLDNQMKWCNIHTTFIPNYGDHNLLQHAYEWLTSKQWHSKMQGLMCTRQFRSHVKLIREARVSDYTRRGHGKWGAQGASGAQVKILWYEMGWMYGEIRTLEGEKVVIVHWELDQLIVDKVSFTPTSKDGRHIQCSWFAHCCFHFLHLVK